jgi:hypothetical protein
MFMAYALVVGLLAGWLLGGSLASLGTLRIRWAPLAVVGLLSQVILFLGPVAERIGGLGMPIYVASTALVLAVVLRNVRMPGLILVAVGALSNLLAIVANGGFMPASAAAMAALGKAVNSGYSNSAVLESPALAPLTDIFALPPFVPFANVFSIGDVMISIGVAVAIASGMRGGARGNLPPTYPRPGTTES